MKTYKKFLALCFALVLSLAITGTASATTPTLSISSNGADNVSLTVTGDANANVMLYYNLSYGVQSTYLGMTNNYGYFYSTLSTNSYGLTAGSLVYVIVNNQQSPSVSWPSYYSNYNYNNNYVNNTGVNISNLVLPVGSSATLSFGNSGTPLTVSSNSNPGIASTTNYTSSSSSSFSSLGCNGYSQYSTLTGQPCYMPITNNGSVVVNALSPGFSTLTLCQNYSSVCGTVTVNVISTGSVLGVSTVDNSCYITRTLRLGMSGTDVSCLQSYLSSKGYMISGANYSSYFDLATKNAVMLFQQDNYLYPDGVVGRQTRARLY